MNMTQQGDVKLFQTDDGGEITVTGGIVEMGGGLETAAYLSLFGGNEDDPGGRGDTSLTWWGNIEETELTRRYRSETGHLLRAIPATVANLRRIEEAVRRDLGWLIDAKVASAVSAEASMPALNRVQIDVRVDAVGDVSNFVFFENWAVSI